MGTRDRNTKQQEGKRTEDTLTTPKGRSIQANRPPICPKTWGMERGRGRGGEGREKRKRKRERRFGRGRGAGMAVSVIKDHNAFIGGVMFQG